MLEPQQFACPHCWQVIEMLVDTSVSEQTYVQDCEVCCNPLEITCRVEGGAVVEFEARELGQ